MKFIAAIGLGLIGMNSLLGDYHHPGVSININPSEKDYSHLKAFHQSTFIFENSNILILNGLYKPHLDNSHHLEGGIGYRKFNGNFGIGINLFYSANNNPGFFAHQFSPGFEWFFGRFQILFNQYYPLKNGINYRKSAFNFHIVSEAGVTYKPSSKYEFGIIPFYNHTQCKWGVNGRAAIFITNALELEVAPFYKPESKGITFSIGINFGGPKGKKSQSIRKSNELFYSEKKLPKPVIPIKPIAPVVKPPAPIKPIPEIPKPAPKPVAKPEPKPAVETPKPVDKPVVTPTPKPVEPPPAKPWPFFFNESVGK